MRANFQSKFLGLYEAFYFTAVLAKSCGFKLWFIKENQCSKHDYSLKPINRTEYYSKNISLYVQKVQITEWK